MYISQNNLEKLCSFEITNLINDLMDLILDEEDVKNAISENDIDINLFD